MVLSSSSLIGVVPLFWMTLAAQIFANFEGFIYGESCEDSSVDRRQDRISGTRHIEDFLAESWEPLKLICANQKPLGTHGDNQCSSSQFLL